MSVQRKELELALHVAAQIVARDGRVFLPIFMRLEREIEKLADEDRPYQRALDLAMRRRKE